MKYEGLDFPQVVEELADRYGVALTQQGQNSENIAKNKSEKEILYKINQLTARFYYDTLNSPEGQRGMDYLKHRNINHDMIREAILGFAPSAGKSLLQHLQQKKAPLDLAEKLGLIRKGQRGDYYDFFRDRVMCSIVSAEGKVLGFSGRALSDEVQPKYLNSPESPIYHKSHSLLGMQTAKAVIREKDQVILVEGNFDMIRLQQEGIRHVVAPLGTALTEQQIRYLSRLSENFILIFDGDAAGQKASARALELFLPLGILPRVVILPSGEDPDSFVRKEGVEALQNKISNSVLLLDYWIEQILSERLASDSKTGQGPQAQAKAIRKVGELLELVPGEIEKVYIYKGLRKGMACQ
ncbi:MAG: DNA primase [Deltaproteobacteria bacterium]|nr:MAG: DNA primase [Deltaproteobacteria bacterium]